MARPAQEQHSCAQRPGGTTAGAKARAPFFPFRTPPARHCCPPAVTLASGGASQASLAMSGSSPARASSSSSRCCCRVAAAPCVDSLHDGSGRQRNQHLRCRGMHRAVAPEPGYTETHNQREVETCAWLRGSQLQGTAASRRRRRRTPEDVGVLVAAGHGAAHKAVAADEHQHAALLLPPPQLHRSRDNLAHIGGWIARLKIWLDSEAEHPANWLG